MENYYSLINIESKENYPIIYFSKKYKEFLEDYFNPKNEHIINNRIVKEYNLYTPSLPLNPKKPSFPSKPPYPNLYKEIQKKKLCKGSLLFVLNVFVLFILVTLAYSINSHVAGLIIAPFIFLLLFSAIVLGSVTYFSKDGRYDITYKTVPMNVLESKRVLYKYEQDYNSLLKKYHYDLDVYNNNYKIYETDLEYYHNEKSDLTNKINKLKKGFLSKVLSEYLYATKQPIRNDDNNVLKGKTEIYFLENYLLPEFKNKIQINTSVGGINSYCPDFVYNDGELYIDIEIDEPYDYVNKKPIHYVGSNDESRNCFFSENNWFVLRFAEKQIQDSPNDCIDFIKS